MRWPWARHARPDAGELEQLRAERERSERALRADRERWAEVHEQSAELRHVREVNHLGRLFDDAFRLRP